MPPHAQFAPRDGLQGDELAQVNEINNVVADGGADDNEGIDEQVVGGFHKKEKAKHHPKAENGGAHRHKHEVFYGLVKPIDTDGGEHD